MQRIVIYGLKSEELEPLKTYLSQHSYVIDKEVVGYQPTREIHGRIGETHLVFPRLIELKVIEPNLENVLNEYYKQLSATNSPKI
ncbi:MAG: hypothetical protein A2912_05850 [Candidatus Buchananbacteria bacterium RIFCSPLOWO2_01_FULL_40_23b]|uniref:Uncharacterized protein n=1 Tax=Candidatus Buchananbacteria bacterium RIFCSPLOWO2_01_FULL_40_23b TaxID=1797544 RepID=A0A1G1YTB1_9BACT|nr:MAG: hypothetical protein A2912_05850 [Candidatus Buchananbacteria bacterium RIFCSPLOWO2_01_FULL_40_23b]